jgi:hypothetical protein
MWPVTWACARPTCFSPGCHIMGLQPGCAWRFAGNSDRACSKASVFVPLCLGGLNRTWCFSALKGPGKMTVNHGATEAQREQKQREEQLSADCGPVSAEGFRLRQRLRRDEPTRRCAVRITGGPSVRANSARGDEMLRVVAPLLSQMLHTKALTINIVAGVAGF